MEPFLFAAAALVAASLAGPLGTWCQRRGLTDPPRGAVDVPERKRGQRPQPLAGGPLLLAGALVASAPFDGALGLLAPPEALFVALAFLLGHLDDRRAEGLGALAKVGGQLLVSAPLALHWWAHAPFGADGTVGALLAPLAALLAFNTVNLWDHADGLVATLVAVAGAACGAPVLGGASAGVLLRQLRPPAAGRPFLGDAGSHAAGAVLLCLPAAWPLLSVPFLDALRVALVRLAKGRSPFEGDRGHLGHLLAARGWPAGRQCAALALLLALIALASVPLG